MFYLSNAFSINMLPNHSEMDVSFQRITVGLASALLREASTVVNGIGHSDTDYLVRNELMILDEVGEGNRVNIKLGEKAHLIVAQYSGPRLPEGTTSLPRGAEIKYFLVTLT